MYLNNKNILNISQQKTITETKEMWTLLYVEIMVENETVKKHHAISQQIKQKIIKASVNNHKKLLFWPKVNMLICLIKIKETIHFFICSFHFVCQPTCRK